MSSINRDCTPVERFRPRDGRGMNPEPPKFRRSRTPSGQRLYSGARWNRTTDLSISRARNPPSVGRQITLLSWTFVGLDGIEPSASALSVLTQTTFGVFGWRVVPGQRRCASFGDR